jgi:hypothetical protein
MQKADYIGYKNSIGFGEATAATGGAALPVTAIIDAAVVLAPFVIKWASGVFQHPAADARGVISAVKPLLPNTSASKRMYLVLAACSKIAHRAKDVEAKELILWYRQNYPNDYKDLSVEDKNYFNNYCLTAARENTDVNQASNDYRLALFTPSQINYNATPAQTVSNLFTSTSTGKTNWVLYGAIAIGAIFLIKNIKK